MNFTLFAWRIYDFFRSRKKKKENILNRAKISNKLTRQAARRYRVVCNFNNKFRIKRYIYFVSCSSNLFLATASCLEKPETTISVSEFYSTISYSFPFLTLFHFLLLSFFLGLSTHPFHRFSIVRSSLHANTTPRRIGCCLPPVIMTKTHSNQRCRAVGRGPETSSKNRGIPIKNKNITQLPLNTSVVLVEMLIKT